MRTSLAVAVMAGWLAGCAATPEALPHALYYLDGPEEGAQVWRLESDGDTAAQVTHEEAGVSDFSVSPADGSLALIKGNQLLLVGGDGESRQVIADASRVDSQSEDYVFRGLIENPVFSPDGRTLAYAFDGLHLYDLASGKDEHVLTNLGNLLGESYVFAKEAYYPGSWSPDGTRLLILMGYYEGSTLAVMNREAAQPYTRLRTDGPVCCQQSWTGDGRSVLVANPFFTGDPPGLWAYDPDTGAQSVLLTGPGDEGQMDFIGWPHQLPSGELIYFHAGIERFSPDAGIPLTIVRSKPDGTDRMQVRPEAFRVHEALWAEDGSRVVVVHRTDDGATQVVLARTDGTPLQVLFEGEQTRGLQWGP